MCHILSNHFFPVLLRLASIPPRTCHRQALTPPHFDLFTCPNHLSVTSLILSSTEATPNLSQMCSFIILLFLVCSYIHLHLRVNLFTDNNYISITVLGQIITFWKRIFLYLVILLKFIIKKDSI